MKKIICKLQNPFPVELLNTLDIGSFDGHRDSLIEKTLIVTQSIKTFMLDKHSIIVGPFGSGKSALFNLLKNRNKVFEKYQNDLIVSIEEQIQFDELKRDTKILFPNLSEKLTFQLLWKFQVCRRICEELAALNDFPLNNEEKYIGEFLHRTGGIGGHITILSRIKQLVEKISIKLKTNISHSPVDVEISKDQTKTIQTIELNLDKLINNINTSIKSRQLRKCQVIIDKLDKFVAGEEYNIQRSYIESLIELEDDLFSTDTIGFKIFIRSDLYDRLDFSALGPDKVEDNTLRLEWRRSEIRSFVAKRLFISLENAEIWSFKDVIDTSDLSDYALKWFERWQIQDKKFGVFYKFAKVYSKLFGRKRNSTTLFESIDLIILKKLFEHDLYHESSNGKIECITMQDFFDSHFLDGNSVCTPRYMMVFLKELINEASNYYSQSPNLKIVPHQVNGDWVYDLFTSNLVYNSYSMCKEKYIRYVSKVDEKWSKYITNLLEKSGSKSTVDYKWIRSNIDFGENQDEQALHFIIYLKVIGFLKVKKHEVDIKKRIFELPILYKKAMGELKSTV